MRHGLISKIILAVFNLALLACGIAILVFGILGLTDPQSIQDLYSWTAPDVPYRLSDIVDLTAVGEGYSIFLICLGSVAIAMAIFGVGTVIENRCIIVTYGVILVLFMLTELGFVVYSALPYSYTSFQKYVLEPQLYPTLKTMKPIQFTSTGDVILPDDESSLAWNTLQQNHSCCGVSGYEDFINEEIFFNVTMPIGFADTSNATVPPSCCQRIDQTLNATRYLDFSRAEACLKEGPEYTNIQGCSDYLMQSFVAIEYICVIGCASLVAIQILCLSMTIHLYNSSRRNKTGNVV